MCSPSYRTTLSNSGNCLSTSSSQRPGKWPPTVKCDVRNRLATFLNRGKTPENQRKANHERLPRDEPLYNLFWSIANIHHLDGMSPLLKHGGQISRPEIALILIADEGYVRSCAMPEWRVEGRRAQYAGKNVIHVVAARRPE